jgi:type II secretory pathway component GspD/PulD (secretin)
MFTRLSGANIIASPSNLTGRITVSLVDVAWKPALQSILEMNNLSMEERSPGSGVYTITPGAPDPMKVKTYFLRYTTVQSVEPVVRSMIPQGSSISTFPSKNAMVVKSMPRNLEDIDQVVLNLDRLRDQVFIEAKFMELDDGAIRDLGINWQSLQEVSLGVGNMTRTLNDSRTWTDSRTDTKAPFDHRTVNDGVNRRSDINNVTYEERTTTYEESPPGSGVYVPRVTITPTRTIGDSIQRGINYDQSINNTFNRTLSDVRTAVLGASDFRVILSALKQITGVTVVSNPKILVANEEPATIHIGERERPFVSSVTPGQQGIAPVVTYNPGDAVDTGVKLTVTPTVNTENNITVRIEPELTRFVRNAVAPNNQTFPVIATKRIRTVFCLESGKTVAIGGLTDTQDREQSTKIPLLGDIPIIGKYLFSHSRKAKSQQETIIFVTVSLASPSAIHRTSGLPEDTELMRRHILKEEAKKAEARISQGQAEEAAAAEAAGKDATTSDASTTPSP